jgi:Ran GTPase-activating protein (RanGAP) involved in mRNA processing and transport
MSSLHNNNTLHTLLARQNHMGNSTAVAIGTMLLQNRELKVLDIAWNVIGPPGGASVAHGLMYNSTLQVSVLTRLLYFSCSFGQQIEFSINK